MNVLITGEVGVGKTTVCEKIIDSLRSQGSSCGGFVCPNMVIGGEVKGKVAVNVSSGDKKIFASLDKDAEGIVIGRYSLSMQGIAFVKRLIADSSACDFVFVDEIGPVDFNSEGILPEAEKVIASSQVVVAVVRSHLEDIFLERFCEQGFTVFEVTEGNRDKIVEDIIAYIQKNA